jgi:hypothetical protein
VINFVNFSFALFTPPLGDYHSLRCTRQRPLEVRTVVTWERLRWRDGGSLGHVSNDDTPKACMTARWKRLVQRILGFMRARVDP